MIDFDSKVALHWQVAAALRSRIAGGEWAPGSHLPSEVDLAHEYSVSRDTLRKAYAALRGEGLIVPGGPGKRSTVAPVPDRHVVWLERDAAIIARMPTAEERRKLGMSDRVAVPVLEVDESGRVSLHAGDRVVLKTT